MEVVTEVLYRAKISNGIILKNDRDFKAVYRGAVRELRCSYGNSTYFESGFAILEQGVSTRCWIPDEHYKSGGFWRSSWISIREICRIDCFSIDGATWVKTRRERK